jgi:predicted TIM-barrel fold metal-dependent hydrolase
MVSKVMVGWRQLPGRKFMQIIDAQIHTWGSGLPSNAAHWQITSFTPREAIALMDEGGVDGAVIHPPSWDPKSTEMAFDAVRTWPGRFAIMGSLPLDKPDETRARLVSWRSQPGMLGLRWSFLHDPARRWLADGTLDWLWAAAEEARSRSPCSARTPRRCWPHCRAPSWPTVDRRSSRRPRRLRDA